MQKTTQGFGLKSIAVFGPKSCARFCCKKLCSVLMQKATQGFGAKSCAGFWCKNLRKVVVEKGAQKGFGVQSYAGSQFNKV